MNLVCRKSKIREKTGLGARGRIQAQPGDWGRLAGWFSQIREIRERGEKNKSEGGRAGSFCLALLYNGSRSMPPCCTSPPPPLPPAPTIFLLFHFFWWHHWIIMILSITPSSSATINVSFEVKQTAFKLCALIFHFLFLFIGFSSREGTRSRSRSTL